MPIKPPIISLHGVGKTFPGVRALHDVSLTLHAGQMVALIGENGAGKSTLMSVIAGVIRPDVGEIHAAGRRVSFAGTLDAQREGVAAIFQELSLAPNLTLAENIFLGREPCTRWGSVDYPRMNAEAQHALHRLGLDIAPDAVTGALRVGQQQIVEIARALSSNARLLILDEPTSALGRQETAALLRLLGELKQAGVAILYITHKFEELVGLADEIAVMRDGMLLQQCAYGTLSRDELVRLMAGRAPNQFRKQAAADGAPEVLSISKLFLSHPTRRDDYLVRDLSLRVRRGEVVGLFGLVGAGRTELLEAVFGVHGARTRGDISIDGVVARINSPADAIAAGIALAPEDRKLDGLILGLTARENAGLASTRANSRFGWLSSRREAGHVKPLLDRLRLASGALERTARSLSGGNQQKVVLAKWLSLGPKVLLLDEPTRGIDVQTKNEIYTLVQELAAGGLAIVMASSEIPEVLALSDRIIVMCEGAKTAEYSRVEADAEVLLRAALPRTSGGAVAS